MAEFSRDKAVRIGVCKPMYISVPSEWAIKHELEAFGPLIKNSKSASDLWEKVKDANDERHRCGIFEKWPHECSERVIVYRKVPLRHKYLSLESETIQMRCEFFVRFPPQIGISYRVPSVETGPLIEIEYNHEHRWWLTKAREALFPTDTPDQEKQVAGMILNGWQVSSASLSKEHCLELIKKHYG